MAALYQGQLVQDWLNQEIIDGHFVREDSIYRAWITPNEAQANRYHLYAAHACPWANRTSIFRVLKGLESFISISYVEPEMLEKGWKFAIKNGVSADSVNHKEYLYEIYQQVDPQTTTQVTVPILWDKKAGTIVNNESSEIIRMFNSAFNSLTGNTDDYYPEALRTEIDLINDKIVQNINNGVYRCGFARSQTAYEEAFDCLFATLEEMEVRLGQQRYLVGDQITEADWRFFTTLIRFDAVYYGHFKCNQRKISEYPNLYQYMLELYQTPGIAQTIDFDKIKRHYYFSHTSINPTQIVPKGPQMQLDVPHCRHISKQ